GVVLSCVWSTPACIPNVPQAAISRRTGGPAWSWGSLERCHMLSTLEGVLIALTVAFSPADGASEGGPMAAAVAADPAAACGRYSSETARRNCVVRLGRP